MSTRTLGRAMSHRFSKGGVLAGIGIGAAMGVANMNPLKNTTSALTEFVFNDENADNQILGRDIGLGNIFPISPKFDWMPTLPSFQIDPALNPASYIRGAKMAMDNPTLVSDAFMDYKDTDYRSMQLAQQHVEDGYTKNPYVNSIYPYRRSVQRGTNASGDMVFGMHNSRMGN